MNARRRTRSFGTIKKNELHSWYGTRFHLFTDHLPSKPWVNTSACGRTLSRAGFLNPFSYFSPLGFTLTTKPHREMALKEKPLARLFSGNQASISLLTWTLVTESHNPPRNKNANTLEMGRRRPQPFHQKLHAHTCFKQLGQDVQDLCLAVPCPGEHTAGNPDPEHLSLTLPLLAFVVWAIWNHFVPPIQPPRPD